MKKNFWFSEKGLPYAKDTVEIRVFVEDILHDEQSQYAHIQVFSTPFFGKMLVIDDIIQTTELDEFIYHEMMVLLPSIRMGSPRKILIIGGGDGGAIKQALRIKSVEEIIQVEIDERVTEVSKKFLPSLSANGFDDPRVKVLFTDGAEFLKSHKNEFDVIVLDLTDPKPDSPAEQLFEEPFLNDVKQALTKDGVVSIQSGSLLFQKEWVDTFYNRLQQVFPWVKLHTAVVPSYQLSPFAFVYASPKPLAELSSTEVDEAFKNITGANKHLTPEMYSASGVIPQLFK
jgi:spermidine synthase